MSAMTESLRECDVAIVGAGFSGLYMLHILRQRGWNVLVLESGGDVGGTWYWNRYPGARCDIPTTDYTYSFDADLEEEWAWSEKYATQPEILAYLNHVADRFELRSDIEFSTRVTKAVWNETERRWHLQTDRDTKIACRFFVLAGGCLSIPKVPDLEGLERFGGELYQTALWPHEAVDVSGKRVAVIGTGSSGVQCIPHLAEQAASLTVFQRTATFSIPAHNGPASEDRLAQLKNDRATYRETARVSRGGIPFELTTISGRSASEEVRRERFDAAWQAGELFAILGVFADQGYNRDSNDLVAEMIRMKIRETVIDPETAEDLCPYEYPFGTKRPCLDTNYFETFNRPNVVLVNLRKHPLISITETGVETADQHYDFDVLVLATGFDAMTGAILGLDIVGRDGQLLRDKWSTGPATYLGLTTVGYPNFFMVTGPGSPSVLSNMLVSIEQHVEWIADCLGYLRQEGFQSIEPTAKAEDGWQQHLSDCAAITLHPEADSWYMGANVPGKPRVLLPYIGGVDAYRAACADVVLQGYLGFELANETGAQCTDGVVRRLQPDVTIALNLLAEMDVPPIETLGVEVARTMTTMTAAAQPSGPEVGAVEDGTMSGAHNDIGYRSIGRRLQAPTPF
jgi:cation diffusion facilitator CzcD-associated flavoprotein CzcO